MRRVGALMNTAADSADGQARFAAFVHGLQQVGWTEGRNARLDVRWAAGDPERIRRYATELVALVPDVILASGGTTLGAIATGEPHRPDGVHGCQRSGRRRPCG